MNIKKSIFILLAFVGVSFSAYSRTYYKVDRVLLGASACGLSVGSAYYDGMCTSGSFTNLFGKTITLSRISRDFNAIYGISTGGQRYDIATYINYKTCADTEDLNESTGQCEERPPQCEDEQVWDPDLKVCVAPPPFCDQPSTQDQIFSAEQSCAAQGGVFKHQCHNGSPLLPPSLETSCNEPPETCIMGFPAWPECLSDYDPTTPITPPSGGFSPDQTLPDANGSGGGGNPPPDGFDKPEPDSVQPTDSTDSAVLQAIINANRDSNQALGHLNQDLNNAFNQANNSLRQLNQLNSAIGKSIVEQMNQDYAIAEANRIQMLNQNSVISGVGEGLENAIGTQTDELGDKLDSLSGTFSGGADNMVNVLENINSGLGGIEDKICDPRTDEFNCEGKGGEVSSEYVTGLITNLTGSVSAADSASSDALTDAIDGLILDSGTGEVQGVIQGNIDLMFGALPTIGSCSPFSLPSYFGPVELGCEFSSRFKSIASFILYIYTAWTLISIILSGVTPIPAASNGTRS